ncbi:MAG: hypothetical protein IRY83_12210 [Chloroflexi bacterium]|nr:hypothetical protein [Chloroflexota bacterium]
MFSRVRTTLLLWNLLIIGAILLAAGVTSYVSQRQSLLADVDHLLTKTAAIPPEGFLLKSQLHVTLDEVVPFVLVVDPTGRVLIGPDNLLGGEIALPKANGISIGGNLNVVWDQGIHVQTVQPRPRLLLLRRTSTDVPQEQYVIRPALLPPGQNTASFQVIGTGTIQGKPVRLLIQPVIVDRVSPGETTSLPSLTSIPDEKPNAYLVTGVSLVPMERSLHQTLVVLLIGAGVGLPLSLLGSWFLAGKALVPIERAYRRQQEFVADAAHELRTPLAILQTAVHLLGQHRQEPLAARGPIFDDLVEEIGRLARLTRDLLDLARSDAGQLHLALGRVDLEQLGQTIVHRLSAVAAERQIDLQFRGSGQPVIAEVDSDRLQQVLLILLDNALRHTPPGGTVTLIVSEEARSAVIDVHDTGEGIPPEVLGRVFDRFYRGDTARSRSTGGTGLGLAIAKALVEAHGGTLTLRSSVGIGTTATIHLPLITDHPPNRGMRLACPLVAVRGWPWVRLRSSGRESPDSGQ